MLGPPFSTAAYLGFRLAHSHLKSTALGFVGFRCAGSLDDALTRQAKLGFSRGIGKLTGNVFPQLLPFRFGASARAAARSLDFRVALAFRSATAKSQESQGSETMVTGHASNQHTVFGPDLCSETPGVPNNRTRWSHYRSMTYTYISICQQKTKADRLPRHLPTYT